MLGSDLSIEAKIYASRFGLKHLCWDGDLRMPDGVPALRLELEPGGWDWSLRLILGP